MTAAEEPRNIPKLRETLERMSLHTKPWVTAAIREYLAEPYRATGPHPGGRDSV